MKDTSDSRALYDHSDHYVCHGSKEYARQHGLFGRSVHIFVFSQEGQVLLCKRPPTKSSYPDQFTSSAGGHVEESESYLTAAQRELAEEVGILSATLAEIGSFTINNDTEHTHHKLYSCQLDTDFELQFAREEISETRWQDPNDIDQLLQSDCTWFADPFVAAWQLFRAAPSPPIKDKAIE